jgi:RNA recognition motif-containing protein
MKLFVGNLSFELTESELAKHFAEFGRVESADIVCDRETGQSRGFGFVRMSSHEDGENAIAGLNGFKVMGRTISVTAARPSASDRFRGRDVSTERPTPGANFYGTRIIP